MPFSIGETVGDYRILEEVGRGGMGRVFKVTHTITKRLEAMKVLEGGRPNGPEQAAASLREIQVQARLEHPNIAAVHNAFWFGADLVLVMELIDGSSLLRLLEAGRIPLATALDYICTTLSALSYAHAHGVVHRDVSPANIMISSSGALKLTDFGLAKGTGDVTVSRSGAPIGSLSYMSPEQVRGTTPADARSDIYAVGALLYELATGKKPFDGETAFSIMVAQVEQSPKPPIEVEPNLPEPLNQAILRALEKDPAKRFPSADDFQRALLTIRNSESVSAKPVSRGRFRLAWAAVALCLAGLAVASFVGARRVPSWFRPSSSPTAKVEDQAPPVTTPQIQEAQPSTTTRPAQPPPSRRSPTAARLAQSPPEHRENRVKRAFGKVWSFVRRKKPDSKND